MKTVFAALLALGFLCCAVEGRAQSNEGAAPSRPRGFVGGLLGVTASQARYGVQFVFPLGITFAI